jgi:hypothetical protein
LAIGEGHQLAFAWKESERANRRGCWDCRDALPADEAEGSRPGLFHIGTARYEGSGANRRGGAIN